MDRLKAERIAIGSGHLSVSVIRRDGESFAVEILENTTGFELIL
ncbi:hypothetical protein [Paenibacillus popilliae]|nr:hypothetical protein [Paenibacillus popilliae]